MLNLTEKLFALLKLFWTWLSCRVLKAHRPVYVTIDYEYRLVPVDGRLRRTVVRKRRGACSRCGAPRQAEDFRHVSHDWQLPARLFRD